ncbi:hypothetical protein HDU96_008452, partial [Phlyctochytrium bullatum]
MLEMLGLLGFSKKMFGSLVDEVLVDNVQWADLRSTNLLTQLMRINLDIFMILLSRPMEEVKAYPVYEDILELLRRGSLAVVNLGTLEATGVASFLEKVVGAKPHHALLEQVLTNSGGIPMVVELLANSLRAPGVLQIRDGTARLAEGTKLKADERDLSGLISSQLDKLSLTAQAILKVASIAGILFSLQITLQVCKDLVEDGELPALHSASDAAEARAMFEREGLFDFLLLPAGPDESDTFSFRHIYIQMGIQDMILSELRRRIHFQFFLYFDDAMRSGESILQTLSLPIPSSPSAFRGKVLGEPLFEAQVHLEASGTSLEDILSKVGTPDGAFMARKIRLEYQIRVGEYFWRRQLFEECRTALKKLFEMWDEMGDCGQNSAKCKTLMSDSVKHRLCFIYAYVCSAKNLLESTNVAFKALNYMKLPFPQKRRDLIWFTLKSVIPLMRSTLEMRRMVWRFEKGKGDLSFLVDDSVINVDDQTLDGLYTLRMGNVFTRPNWFRNLNRMLLVDQFRAQLCGQHTASAIAYTLFQFAQELVRLESNFTPLQFPAFHSDMKEYSAELERIGHVTGADGVEDGAHPVSRVALEEGAIGANWMRGEEIAKHRRSAGRSKLDRRKIFGGVSLQVGPQIPGLYDVDGAQVLWGVGFAARSRDLLELEEWGLRMSAVLLYETKNESSYVFISVAGFYRELMFFAGAAKLSYLFAENIFRGYIPNATYKPWVPCDACLYATSGLSLTIAEKWERVYWRVLGRPDFLLLTTTPHDLGKSPGLAASSTAAVLKEFPALSTADTYGVGEKFLPLPPILDRDMFSAFFLFRTARVAVELEQAFAALRPRLAVLGAEGGCRTLLAAVEAVERAQGTDLEQLVAYFETLVAKVTQPMSSSVRRAIVFRCMTVWQVLRAWARIKVAWLACGAFASEPMGGNGAKRLAAWLAKLAKLDPFKGASVEPLVRRLAVMKKRWAQKNATFTVTVTVPMHEGTILMASGKIRQARGQWIDALLALEELEAGKAVQFPGMAGEFREPLEWRGVRFWAYQREFLKGMVLQLDALETAEAAVAARSAQMLRGGGGRKIGPAGTTGDGGVRGELRKKCEGDRKDLEKAAERLGAFGILSRFDCFSVNVHAELMEEL